MVAKNYFMDFFSKEKQCYRAGDYCYMTFYYRWW